MSMRDSPIARANWLLRTPDFSVLRDGRDRDGSRFAVMRYQRPDHGEQSRVVDLWRALPPHRSLLEVVDADRSWVDLRYAAIDWKASPAGGPRAMKLTWAVEVAAVLAHVARCVDTGELGWLACPFVKLDLEQRVRLGFSPIADHRVPPESRRRWPRCDERGLVFVVGKLLSLWALGPDAQLAPIIARATGKPARRHPTLVDLQDALVGAGAQRAPLSNDRDWYHVEHGVGLLMRGWPASAREYFERARDHELARALLHVLDRPPEAATRDLGPSGSTSTSRETPPREVPSAEALARKTRGLLAARNPEEALCCAEELVALDPADGRAQHLRGRCLLVLGRFAEARDAFATASTRSPQLLEAMLLRREAERALASLRAVVGTQPALAVDLPAHLAAYAGAFTTGNVGDVIALLDRDHSHDGAAQLVLANCLVFAKRLEDAIATFDRAARLDPGLSRAAHVGQGFALLELDRAEEALGVFDGYPDDLDALEGRVRALERLGRGADSDAALRKLLDPGRT